MRPTRVISLAASAVLGVSLGMSAVPASAAPISEAAVAAPAATPSALATLSQTTIPITQVIDGVGTLAGTFTPTQFMTQKGKLALQGVFQGTFTALNGVVTPITQTG